MEIAEYFYSCPFWDAPILFNPRSLDDVAREREVEFVKIARELIGVIFAELFGIPEEEREFFRSCANTMTAFFGGAVEYTNDVAIEANNAASGIREYFSGIVQKRRKNPQDDFVSGMIEAQKQFNISEEEIISQGAIMLAAGKTTIIDQMCNNFFLLLNNPDILQAIRANRELLPNAMEEFKCIDPAVTFIFRVALADAVINGQQINEGEAVFISNHCANRDMSEAEAPHRIRVDHKGIRHLAYGYGAHYCIGARLARLQMQELFDCTIDLSPNLRLSPDRPPGRDHYSLSFSGFKTLPIICL